MPELALRFTSNPFRLVTYALSVLAVARVLRATVQRTCPEVIHANSIRAGLITALATSFSGIPIQWHVHDNLPPRALSFAIRAFAALSRRSRFVAVSHSTATNLAGPVLPQLIAPRTSVLLNAVDTPALQPEALARLRAEFAFSADTFCIVHAAQIAPRKDQLGAVRAFHLAFGTASAARLLLIGEPVFDGNDLYLDRVREEVRTLGLEQSVLFLGHRKDVPQLMQGADLVLLNSLNDPCPLTILEAMAAAAPILASRVDGIPELVTDGFSGWLATPGNPHGFARRLAAISLLPKAARTAVGQAARRWIQERPLSRYVQDFAAITHRSLAPTPLQPEPEQSTSRIQESFPL
jgi:glycosyltransferase involved in cell wall biosynthesis